MNKMTLKITREYIFTSPRSNICRLFCMFLVLAVFFSHLTARAEENQQGLISPEQLAESLDNAVANQRDELESLKGQLRDLENLRDKVQDEIKTYDSQNTAHSQILLTSQLRIENLENAIKNNRFAFRNLSGYFEIFQKRLDSTSILLGQIKERIELVKAQIADIRGSQFSDTWKSLLAATSQSLNKILDEKKQIGEGLHKTEENLLRLINDALEENKTIGDKLMLRLEDENKASIFKRFDSFGDLSGEAIRKELGLFWSRIRSVFDSATWSSQWIEIKMGGFEQWSVFFVAMALILLLQYQSKVTIRKVEKRCEGPEYDHRRMALVLLRRSLPYFGMVLLFGFYSSLRFSLFNISLGRALFGIFLILLATQWGLDYLKYGFSGPPTVFWSFVSHHIRRFFQIIRTMAIIVLMLSWIAERDSILIWLLRNVLSAVFLSWALVFWLKMKRILFEGRRQGQEIFNLKWIKAIRAWTYLVIGGTLFLNLLGYRMLGGLWFEAWIKTLAILFWGYISLNAVREWRQDFLSETAADIENKKTSKYHIRWTLIQLTQAFCFFAMAVVILWAWDTSGFLTARLADFFNFTVTMGSLKLNVKGIILAVGILYITRFAVRIGRSLLKEKILDRRSLEIGLKDSILTITSYLGWTLGLLLALGIIGVNATSIAVIFGGLSIGIGFGMQTIFNNFFSGLILLFERPIQVGDTVEINGMRAEVKKINVRATVVQTFDNASVIIPNSEFVSKQVTNWSFKDKRMRRNIEIGVAYGSDIDLVQNTMLEIANKKRNVLKYPKPDVIFIDHADSALIFRLRVWVHLDDYWTIPSQIRNEIDHRFRELGIEIAFPQRDLHIRSLPAEIAPASSTVDSDGVKENPVKNIPEPN
jgi:potassium-dependent mechanosensitive channel